MTMHPTVARVVEAALGFGIDPQVQEFPDGTRTAIDAARAVGCDVAQIVKSLVWVCDGEPVLALVSGANRLDPAKLAKAAGATDARRADADEAREATGYAIGGTPPFGHARALRVFVDTRLLGFGEVWCAAGTPTTVFALAPNALVRATRAVESDLAEDT